jgi:hypothetical protein
MGTVSLGGSGCGSRGGGVGPTSGRALGSAGLGYGLAWTTRSQGTHGPESSMQRARTPAIYLLFVSFLDHSVARPCSLEGPADRAPARSLGAGQSGGVAEDAAV